MVWARHLNVLIEIARGRPSLYPTGEPVVRLGAALITQAELHSQLATLRPDCDHRYSDNFAIDMIEAAQRVLNLSGKWRNHPARLMLLHLAHDRRAQILAVNLEVPEKAKMDIEALVELDTPWVHLRFTSRLSKRAGAISQADRNG